MLPVTVRLLQLWGPHQPRLQLSSTRPGSTQLSAATSRSCSWVGAASTASSCVRSWPAGPGLALHCTSWRPLLAPPTQLERNTWCAARGSARLVWPGGAARRSSPASHARVRAPASHQLTATLTSAGWRHTTLVPASVARMTASVTRGTAARAASAGRVRAQCPGERPACAGLVSGLQPPPGLLLTSLLAAMPSPSCSAPSLARSA